MREAAHRYKLRGQPLSYFCSGFKQSSRCHRIDLQFIKDIPCRDTKGTPCSHDSAKPAPRHGIQDTI